MDFMNQALAQLRDLFGSMTPGARITAALLLVAIVVGLGFLFTMQVSGGDTFLLDGRSFSSEEMTAIQAAFGSAGLNGWAVDGSQIRIPFGQRDAYLAALAENQALPEGLNKHYESEALKALSPFASKAEREQLTKVSLEKNLARTIRHIRGIRQATVTYDAYIESGLKRKRVATASVGVEPLPGGSITADQVEAIRYLVGNAAAGLSPQHVSVVDLSSSRVWAGSSDGDGPGSALDDPYLPRVRAYESDYQARIANALSYVPGVTVSVNVELDREFGTTSESVSIDSEKAAAVSTVTETLSRIKEGTEQGGRPGLQAQQPNAPGAVAAAGRETRDNEEKQTLQEQKIVPHEKTFTQTHGLTPKLVTAAIAVPSTYFVDVWHRRNPTPAGEDATDPEPQQLTQLRTELTAAIRKHVERLLPKPVNPTEANSLVEVTTFDLIKAPELDGPSSVDRALSWLAASWSTLAMIALGLFGLVTMRSMLKATPPAPQTDSSVPPPPEHEDDEESEEGGTNRLKRRSEDGPSLREELSDIVRDDPDAAAKVLRSWIGSPT